MSTREHTISKHVLTRDACKSLQLVWQNDQLMRLSTMKRYLILSVLTNYMAETCTVCASCCIYASGRQCTECSENIFHIKNSIFLLVVYRLLWTASSPLVNAGASIGLRKGDIPQLGTYRGTPYSGYDLSVGKCVFYSVSSPAVLQKLSHDHVW